MKAERPASLLPDVDSCFILERKKKRETRVQQKLFKALLNSQLKKKQKNNIPYILKSHKKRKPSIKLNV